MKGENFFFLLSFLSPLVLVISVIFSLTKFNFFSQRDLVLFSYVIVCLVFDLLTRFYAKHPTYGTNIQLMPWFSLIELLFFSIYYRLLGHKVALQILGFLGLGFIGLELFYSGQVSTVDFQPYARTVSTFIILLYSMSHILKIVKGVVKVPKAMLNLSITSLIYFFTQLMMLLPINYLVNTSSRLSLIVWSGNLLIHILFYSYLGVYLWKSGKQTKPLSFG